MNVDNEARAQKIDVCRRLYFKYKGQHHELIEREMREMGYADFHRRILYKRCERGKERPGWLDRFGWRAIVDAEKEGRSDAGKSSPPYEGGVAAASADGVVLSSASDQRNSVADVENHPVGEAPTPLRKEGSRNGPPASPCPALSASTPGDFDEFQQWLKRVSPGMTWDWKYQLHIYKHLKRVTEGDCKRLMIFVPPRHGKSELVTVRYAAWRLKQKPETNIILGSYNQRLANRFSRKVRKVLAEDHANTALLRNADCGLRNEETLQIGTAANPQSAIRNLQSKNPQSAIRDPQSDGPMFPFIRARQANSEAEWETKAGGGVRAVGVGAGVTGYGASLIIVDDPVKSRAEAESETFREKVWEWFNDDLYTRLEPDGAIILIQTRWHEDDLAGRLLREMKEEGGEEWDVISLPALAEAQSLTVQSSSFSLPSSETEEQAKACTLNEQQVKACIPSSKPRYFYWQNGRRIPIRTIGGLLPGATIEPAVIPEPEPIPDIPPLPDKDWRDELGREAGQALCPARYPEAALEKVKRKLGSYSFAALYQQHPVPADGGLFKRHWFKIVDHLPAGLTRKRGYDLGMSKKTIADYTASLGVGIDREGSIYIYDGFRRQMEYPEQKRYILGRIAAEPSTEHLVELSANGNAVIQDLRTDSRTWGRALRGVRVSTDKVTRALPWIALAEEGRVHLVRGAWNNEFLDEVCSFPSGPHDDQIDAVSLAVQMLRAPRKILYRF